MKNLISKKPIGFAGGTISSAGNNEITSEFLGKLQGILGSKIYQKMSLTDSQVSMVLNAYKNPIKACNWGINDLGDESKKLVEIKEVIEAWFFKAEKKPFSTFLNQILSFIEYGFSAFEKYYVPFEYKGFTYLMPKLEQRVQVSINEINLEKRYVKQDNVNGSTVDIPLDNMVFFILNQSGDDWRGSSLIRPAYPSWESKLQYETILGIGAQRGAVGIPHVTIPDGFGKDSKEFIMAAELCENMIAHAKSYMVTTKSMEFDVINFNFDSTPVLKIIQYKDLCIALSVLNQFLMLGQGSGGGSYALGEDQSEMFLDGLNYIINYIEQVLLRHVISPLIEINWGVEFTPEMFTIKGNNLNKKAGKKLSEMVKNYSDSKFLKPTVEDEQHVRKLIGLPELSKEDIQKRKDEESNPPINTNVPSIPAIPPDKEPKKLSESPQTVSKRNKKITEETENLTKFMRANLQLIKDKLVIDVKNVLKKGSIEIDGLKNIEVGRTTNYKKALESKLAYLANFGWLEMQQKASKHKIKLSENLDPKDLKSKILKKYVENEAEMTVFNQAAKMKLQAIQTAGINSMRGMSIGQAVAEVSKILDLYIESGSIDVASSYITVGAINFGGNEFNRQIEDSIWGYRFVAVDDDGTTELCRSLSGKTYTVNGTELTVVTPPLHARCRSYLEPIYKDEVKPDKIDDYIPPPSILKGKQI